MYEKNNPNSRLSKEKQDILTREFLRKYIHYAKNKFNPSLTKEANEFISKSWVKLREKSVSDECKGKVIPITARTLESLIRIATAFAKARLSNVVERIDCENALELVADSIFHENVRENNYEDDNYMDLVNEEEEEENKHKKKSKKEKSLPLDEDDDEKEEKEKKSKKHRSKKSKEKKELDDLVEAEIEEGDEEIIEDDDGGKVTEEQANVIFRFVYENAKKKRNQTIAIDELWSIIKDKKECKDKKILKKNKLIDICATLEEEGKIFVSETKEITLV
jgi:DNA replication licensing factor MCM3